MRKRVTQSRKMVFGRYDYAAFISFFSYASGSVVVPVVLVFLARDLGFSLEHGGLSAGGALHLGRTITMVASMLLCGFLAGRWGKRRTLGWSVVLMGLAMGLCALAPSYGILFLALMIAGTGEGIIEGLAMACCGDVPTLETLAAVSILRAHLPDLKIRVVNVVDLMRLEPRSEHPHGLSDMDFDELFTKDKPVIFAFHAYPWLIHRLTYRRTNHHNIHVRGYKEEGTITTPFDMTVLNELDRFHLVMDAIDRLPQTGDKGIYLKQQLQDKLIEHKQYINKHGQDMPEIRNWNWSNPK
jgi:hypothetical protein